MKSTASPRPRTDRAPSYQSSEIRTAFPRQIRTPVSRKTPEVLINDPVYGLWNKTTSACPESRSKADSFGQLTAEWHESELLQNPRVWPGTVPGAFHLLHTIAASLTLYPGSGAHLRRLEAWCVLTKSPGPLLFFLRHPDIFVLKRSLEKSLRPSARLAITAGATVGRWPTFCPPQAWWAPSQQSCEASVIILFHRENWNPGLKQLTDLSLMTWLELGKDKVLTQSWRL